MNEAVKIQIEIQPDVYQALKSKDYSYIFEALKRVSKSEDERNGEHETV